MVINQKMCGSEIHIRISSKGRIAEGAFLLINLSYVKLNELKTQYRIIEIKSIIDSLQATLQISSIDQFSNEVWSSSHSSLKEILI